MYKSFLYIVFRKVIFMLKKVKVKCNKIIMEDILNFFSIAQNQRKEKILLGFANQIDGKYIINKVFYFPSFGNENYVVFNTLQQVKFLKWCIINKKIPIILHNHVFIEDIIFSAPDVIFFNKLLNCFKKLDGEGVIIVGLINLNCDLVMYMEVSGE